MKSYNEENIASAMIDVESGVFPSLRAAASAYNIPQNTLTRRYNRTTSSRVQKARDAQLLSPLQEKLLGQWILDGEACRQPRSHYEVREMASKCSAHTGGPARVGHNWISRFLQRNPHLKSKIGRKIDTLRVDAATPEVLQGYFDSFKTIRDQYKIDPANCWNMDETGMALGVCSNQRVLRTVNSNVSIIKTPNNREWVTILECISAKGEKLRPLVIFRGQSLQTAWFDKEVPDMAFTHSPNGWTNDDIGLRWLNQMFLPLTTPEEGSEDVWRLLIMDNHGSHISSDFMWTCWHNHIYLLYLPPHTSHLLQPLDVSCFSPLKTRYRSQIMALASLDDSAPVKKQRFISIYNKARDEGLTYSNIISGWRGTGMWPYDPKKVLRSSLVTPARPLPISLSSSESSRPSTPSENPLIDPPIFTPYNRSQLDLYIMGLRRQNELTREVRTLLQKTCKAMDRFHWQQSQDLSIIASQNARIESLSARKQKSVAISSNTTFLNIFEIREAQEEANRRQEAWEASHGTREAAATSAAMQQSHMEDMQFEWQLEC